MSFKHILKQILKEKFLSRILQNVIKINFQEKSENTRKIGRAPNA